MARKIPMYRSLQSSQKTYVALDSGGCGDNIAALPAVKYILDYHPHVDMTLWVPSYFESLARRSLGKSKQLTIKNFNDTYLADPRIPVKSFAKNPFTNFACEMTAHAFNVLCGINPEAQYKNYLPIDLKHILVDKFNLPKKFVVVTTGFTAKVRELLPEHVNLICQHIKSKGYDVVFLGKTETETAFYAEPIKGNFAETVNFDLGVNLIDQTTLLESAAILKQSSGIVGLDNGLLHLAGTTDIPIIGGFTTVRPEHRMPYRNDVMGWNYYPVSLTEQELECSFCQSNWGFTFHHDFRNCYYKDYQCTKMLNADKYIVELDKIL
jgi:ADP-heptose:LPS heptosyltransferase